MLVTPLLAAIFGLMFVVLSLAVVRHRFNQRVILGDGENIDLRVAIRVHANFIEYVPLALILLWCLEAVLFDNSGFVLIMGVVLLLARFIHVIGMRYPKQWMILRQLGMVGTFSVYLVVSLRILWHYLPF